MTETQRAVMFGPYSNHGSEVPHLTVDTNGTTQIKTMRANTIWLSVFVIIQHLNFQALFVPCGCAIR